MSTFLAPLSLYVAKDCDADQAWRVYFWSVLAVLFLSWQFEWLALATILGSIIGLAILEMASIGARDVRKSIAVSTTRSSSDRAESNSVRDELDTSAARVFISFMSGSFYALIAMFASLGLVHVALSPRLFPFPVFSRA